MATAIQVMQLIVSIASDLRMSSKDSRHSRHGQRDLLPTATAAPVIHAVDLRGGDRTARETAG